jgi:hypothetical protein
MREMERNPVFNTVDFFMVGLLCCGATAPDERKYDESVLGSFIGSG